MGSLPRSWIKLAHRLGLSPLMRRARHVARSRGESLKFRYSGVIWGGPNRPDILLSARDPYFLWGLIDGDQVVMERIVNFTLSRTGGMIDLRGPTLFGTYSGREVWMSNFIEKADTCAGYFEHGAPQLGDVAVDVGAYCGEITLEMAERVGPEGHVYAMEPDLGNRVLLQKNIDRHGVGNVTILPYGLWNKSGDVAFHMTGSCGSAVQSVGDGTHSDTHLTDIKTLSPSDLFARIGVIPDFIKMDIEGAEVEAVGALIPLLTDASKPMRMAIASYHMRNGRKTHEIITPMLLAAGFTVETGFPEHPTTWAEIGYGNV